MFWPLLRVLPGGETIGGVKKSRSEREKSDGQMKVLFENEGHRFSLLNDLKEESQYGTTPINGSLLSFQKREYLARSAGGTESRKDEGMIFRQ